ncbi:hypothetical protein EDD15DRAFT_715634 [Pisolithus albus]|nr:hypothetical protein EDD15DRAFT_715634 [Pisolithus albus]
MFSVHLREPTSYMVSSSEYLCCHGPRTIACLLCIYPSRVDSVAAVPLYPLINKKYYPCGWAVLDNVCGVPVPGASFSEHLREAHVIGIVQVSILSAMLHVRYPNARVVLIPSQVAGLPPHKKYYRCGRAVLDNVCGVLVPGESLSVHLREAHFISAVQVSIFAAMVHGRFMFVIYMPDSY